MGSRVRKLSRATFAIVDVETTGFDPATDRVVEVACLLVRRGRRLVRFETRVDPGRSIPPRATAVHGIRDRDVAGAPPLEAVAPFLGAVCADAIVVAHNASFDLGFLAGLRARPVLCSMRFARLVVPEAPNHTLQGLRAYLGLRGSGVDSAVAHSALGDVAVTHALLAHCIERHLARGGPDDAAHLLERLAPRRRVA